MLAATIKSEDYQEIQKANKWADLIELRLDLFQPKCLQTLRQACKKPVIFKMLEPNWEYLSHNPDYVDLPHDVALQYFPTFSYPKIKKICSFHDETKTPPLEPILEEMKNSQADIYKIATKANSSVDGLKMLAFVKKTKCLGLCMGELGSFTRVLSTIFGSPFTFAPISLNHQTAPGQILLKDHLQTYYTHLLSPKSKIFGLIGDPVSQSPSHQTHNFAFRKLGVDAVYVKMEVKPHELAEFLSLSKELGFKGLSVTIPLKEKVISFLKEPPEAAINTLCFREGSIEGRNTDGVGALDAIEKRMKVDGKKVILLGSGGAAIGIAKEAKKRGAVVVIVNRTLDKAKKLAEMVSSQAFSLDNFKDVACQGYDILINCTSVGMGEDKNMPVKEDELLENRLVMETITKPKETLFLAAAKRKNCEVIEGMEMFIQQAVGQFCYWLGEK